MHEWLLHMVVLPTIKSMCDLCENHGISFFCHIEWVDQGGMTTDYLTHSIQADSTEIIKNTMKAAQGKLKDVNTGTKT